MVAGTATGREQTQLSFRAEETKQLFNWATAGESALVVGASGVGKSNLFNHLLDPRVQRHYLDEQSEKYLLIRVNFHDAPDQSARTVYSLILEQLEILPTREYGVSAEAIAQIASNHEALLDAGEDALKVRRYFRLAIRALLRDNERHLVLLFDQFDDIYREAPGHLFANLRGLREAYKYRISYFVFSRHDLRPAPDEEPQREEFYELLSSNLLGLKPYAADDARHVLKRISARHQLEVTEVGATQLIRLSGGHAGLLRALFLANLPGRMLMTQDMSHLLAQTSVYGQCESLWHSLALEERHLLAGFVQEVVEPEEEKAVWEMLKRKGMVTANTVFSPVFAAYVTAQDLPEAETIFLDESTKRVLVHGKPSRRLTALEYRLFRAFYEKKGEIVDRDVLIAAGWPEDDPAGISESSLSAAIYRLRRKINPEGEEFIETVQAHGWRLNEEAQPA